MSITESTTTERAEGIQIVKPAEMKLPPDGEAARRVAVVGLDRFDEYNDRWGRVKGDLALEVFERWLQDRLPDSLVRPWSGARFTVDLAPGDEDQLDAMIPRFSSALEEAAGTPNSLTFSGAVTRIVDEGLEEATERASRGLSRARRAGGARILNLDGPHADRGTVLFAEDDELTARLVSRLLEQEGFEVRHFADGAAALKWAETADACLIVADVLMPHMDGFELVQSLRAIPRHLHTRIVLLTSMNREADVLRGFSVGADDYIQKPFSPRELKARLLKWAPHPEDGPGEVT